MLPPALLMQQPRELQPLPAGPKVKLSTIATTVTQNYATCRANAEQLSSLQEWINEQNTIINGQ
ncbi:hypothetical protein SAMN05216409_1313 [Pseudomonas lutea]|uniref:Uncharacterized protein n=2 Tax=Pseudomonas lutea TaxID=243924 RepID=A0A9X8MHR9_9PSED|nr:hypothetical protein SAMN05216409_1303 [Pseudomonas lutea]SER50575.1 hypothetical protein SAMN05216409_1313 [Pseudomonas lutea]